MTANLPSEINELLGPTAQAGHRVASSSAAELVPPAADGELAIGGAYEGADRFDRSMALWQSPIRSADADLLPDKEIGDGRIRDMGRNDAYVQGAANLHKDNIVGAQFLLNARPSTRFLWGKDDDVWEEEFQEEVEEVFDLYGDSSENYIDASRTNNFTQLIRMGVGIHLASGNTLAAVEWDRDRTGDFATMIQMIDLDRLSTDPKSANDPNVRAGIRFDRRGAPLAYQIRTEHPHDLKWSFTMPEWKEIAIRKPWGRLQVLHIHEQIRPDQSVGYSELLAGLKGMRIFSQVRDINLQHKLAQSLYAAAITSDLPTDAVFAQLGGGEFSPEAVEKAVTGAATGILSAINKYAGNAKNLQIDGVRIPHLYPGTKLEMLAPTSGGPLGSEFETSLLRYIAASAGVSYEQLSRDYTSTNYSSARAAGMETWKYMQARKKLVADRFASAIFRLWLEEAINENKLSTFPAKKAGMLYTNRRLNLKFDAISRADWIGASRGQIDEYKETQAAVLRMENGLTTAEDELARLGKDWRKVYRQLKREQARRELLGLNIIGSGSGSQAYQALNDVKDEVKSDDDEKSKVAA